MNAFLRQAIGLTITLSLSACAAPIVPGYLTTAHPAHPAASVVTGPALPQALRSYQAFVNTPSPMSPEPHAIPPGEGSRPQGHTHHHAMIETE